MSGHSKWHKIKHQKAQADSKKSKLFGRFSRDIKIAARQGTDPALNSALREALDRAKKANLPQANIDRLLNRDSASVSTVLYEAHGPGGAAILIDAQTDNTNRTVSELRALLIRHHGSLSAAGSVHWKFHPEVSVEALLPKNSSPDAIELELIDAGANDFQLEERDITISAAPGREAPIITALKNVGAENITAAPGFTVSAGQQLTLPPEQFKLLEEILSELSEHDDVVGAFTDARPA